MRKAVYQESITPGRNWKDLAVRRFIPQRASVIISYELLHVSNEECHSRIEVELQALS